MKAKCAGTIVVAGGSGVEGASNALLNYITLSSNLAQDKVTQVCGLARNAGDIGSNLDIVEQARRLGKSIAQEILNG